MRSTKRWIALALAVLMCLSLCGCQALEDMRAAHAVWQEDGSILWNGQVYRPLENVPEEFQFHIEQWIMVTEPDVPVLLSDLAGDGWSVDADGILMHNRNYNGEEVYFCREDKHEEMLNYFQTNIELDTYFYNYWPEEDGEVEEAVYYLSDAEKAAVDSVLNWADFVEVDDDYYYSFEDDEFSVMLGRCDGKHLFAEYHAVEIVSKRDGYYLFVNEMLAKVPSEYDAIFAEIVADYYTWEVLPYL